jgi:hypothetical protein
MNPSDEAMASEYETTSDNWKKYSESPSSVAERDTLREMVLLRWGVGAVGAGSVPGGAVGGARFGVLRLGEGRVPSRDCVGRGAAKERGRFLPDFAVAAKGP